VRRGKALVQPVGHGGKGGAEGGLINFPSGRGYWYVAGASSEEDLLNMTGGRDRPDVEGVGVLLGRGGDYLKTKNGSLMSRLKEKVLKKGRHSWRGERGRNPV